MQKGDIRNLVWNVISFKGKWVSIWESDRTDLRNNEAERIHREGLGGEGESGKKEQKRVRESIRPRETATGSQLTEGTSGRVVHQNGKIAEFHSKKIVKGYYD